MTDHYYIDSTSSVENTGGLEGNAAGSSAALTDVSTGGSTMAGSAPSGGTTMQGTATGGAPTGGTSTQGTASGGTTAVDTMAGGASTGGTTAVDIATGGASTGGTTAGDTTAGGASTGGTTAVDTATGGDSSGGTTAVDTAAGGASTGGTTAADTTVGGASTGGTTAADTATGSVVSGGTSNADLCGSTQCLATCCSGVCVDVSSDPSNCADCSHLCAVGQACVLGVCTNGWSTMAAPPAGFAAREKAAYVGFDNKLFIFGGADVSGNALGDGAIYDATTNRWTLVSIDANAPSSRILAAAVWTGSKILVYGGSDDSSSEGLSSGAAYDPNVDQWLKLASIGTGRIGAIGIATSSYAAFWGGWETGSTVLSGTDRIDLTTNVWQTAVTGSGEPGALDNPAWAFTGQYLYLFGGRVGGTTKTNQSWTYTLSSNSWQAWSTVSNYYSRWGAFGVWDGTSFFFWGGRDDTNAKSNGQVLSGGSWSTMSQTGVPSARWAPRLQSGWAFARATGDLLFVGGQDASNKCLRDGGRYVSGSGYNAGTWTKVPAWTSAEDHQWSAAAYLGGTLVVWGGRTGTALSTTGDRWSL